MSLTGTERTNLRFDFTTAAFDDQPFSVIELEGVEALSRPFRFTLTLVAHDRDIDLRKVLQNIATLRIYSADGKRATPYHGMLAEFHQMHEIDGNVFYQAVLVPRLWQLSMWHISEVYLNEKSIPDIISDVLKDGRLSQGQDFEQKLTQSYRPRSFVCEFEESHLDFASRWMEKEGIYYYFDHDGSADKLMMVDDKLMQPADPLELRYLPDDRHDSALALDAVQSFASCHRPMPHQVVLRDFNYRKAAVELKCTAQVSADGIGEVMYYGENFRDADEGNRYAKLRAEQIRCGGEVFSGKATAVGLRTGYFIDLSGHYRSQFNARYLVTEIHHQGSQAGALLTSANDARGGRQAEIAYRCEFVAIPADTQFRPARATPSPRIDGTLTATIDAEGSGQYAELDEYGQYKVQLPFDRSDKPDDKGSARVRMASPYAGTDHGMHFPLHKGTEVLLSFADGNPDSPVIIGAVANAETPNQVTSANPSQSVIHTQGGNRVQMEDTQGQQSILLATPSANSSIRIGSGPLGATPASSPAPNPTVAALDDAQGTGSSVNTDSSSGVVITTNENVVVLAGPNAALTTPTTDTGDYQAVIDGSYTLIAGDPGGAKNNPDANYTANIAGNWSTTAGGTIDAKSGGDFKLTVGGASTVNITGDSTTTVLGKKTTNTWTETKSISKGYAQALYLEANDALYIGQRGQLMALVNSVMNLAAVLNVTIGAIVEFNASARLVFQTGVKGEYGTIVDKRAVVVVKEVVAESTTVVVDQKNTGLSVTN